MDHNLQASSASQQAAVKNLPRDCTSWPKLTLDCGLAPGRTAM